MQNRINEIADFNEDSANWKWHKIAQDLRSFCQHRLTDWEREFLANIPFRRKPLSERQRRTIHKLYARVVVGFGEPDAFAANRRELLRMDE
jgi:hypothetical protein